MSLRAVIFDFDFTLVDSSRGFIACHDHVCREMALPPVTPAQSMAMMGTPLAEAFVQLFPAEHHARAPEYVRLWQARADEVMTGLTEVYPDAPAAVRVLKAQGLRLAIVSQKLRYRIEAVLERDSLASCFDVVVGGGDTSAFKPDPEGILKAAAALGATTDEAIYVGDTVIDGRAATNAGVRFVAVLSGVTPREALDALEPLAVLDGVAGLPDLCRSLS